MSIRKRPFSVYLWFHSGFAMIVDDSVISHLNVEAGPGVDVSSAETMMALL